MSGMNGKQETLIYWISIKGDVMQKFAWEYNRTLIVKHIDYQEDRTLLYGDNPNYHIIASKDCTAKEGDLVTYEPFGYNFGWFVKLGEDE